MIINSFNNLQEVTAYFLIILVLLVWKKDIHPVPQSSSFKNELLYQLTLLPTKKHCPCPISHGTPSGNGKQEWIKMLGLPCRSKDPDSVEDK